MSVRLYVEGGGDHNKALQTQCRKGFSEFIRNAGFDKRMPRIVACGGRRQAYDSFRTANEGSAAGMTPLLLVDSEAPVTSGDPWDHVKNRSGDSWDRPRNSSDDQLHFMVQTMEAWFYADKDTLRSYFGQEFRLTALSQRDDIENIPRADVISGLVSATRPCESKGEYSKGQHSFQILELLDPSKVRAASPYADRLLNVLDRLS